MLAFDYLPESEVISTLTGRPESQSVALPCRGGGQALREAIETVSEAKEVKHASAQGFPRDRVWTTDIGRAPCDPSRRL